MLTALECVRANWNTPRIRHQALSHSGPQGCSILTMNNDFGLNHIFPQESICGWIFLFVTNGFDCKLFYIGG